MKKTLLFTFGILLFVGAMAQDPSLVLSYEFEDTTDASIYENHMINHNVTFVEDRFGNPESAAYFNGKDAWFEIPADESYQLETFPMTISLWVMYDDSAAQNMVFVNASGYNQYGGVFVGAGYVPDRDRSLVSMTFGNGGAPSPPSRKSNLSSDGFGVNEWKMITVIGHKIDSVEIFIGTEKSAIILDGSATSMKLVQDAVGAIGKHIPADQYFSGYVDDFKMWNVALTPENVSELYVNREVSLAVSSVQKENLRVYPNPTNDELKWDRSLAYELRDMTGLLVSQGEGDSVNMSGFSEGVYLLQVNGQVYKIIKQ